MMLAVGITEAFGHEIEPPGYTTIGRLVAAQFVWPIMPLRLAYLLFQRPDFLPADTQLIDGSAS